MPRRKSDTQQTDSALWEYVTLRAAQLGAAPALFDAWWSKHAHGEWPSGLYLVSERLSLDMDTLLTEHPREVFAEYIDSIGRESIECVKRLAYDRLFVYDLKPSNMMVHLMEDGEAHVRVIDFGREFCEWDVEGADTPVIDMLDGKGVYRRDSDLLHPLCIHAHSVGVTTTHGVFGRTDALIAWMPANVSLRIHS